MFVCMFNAPMPMSLPSHACMLGFAFSHAFMFISTCLDVYPHAYMRISMLICVDWCVYMLRSMFSTCLYTKANIKGFGSSYLHVYACLLLCFILVLASLVLGFAMLDALRELDLVWLHSTPMRPCWMWPFGKHLWMPSCFIHTFPFPLRMMLCLPCLFAPPVGFLCIFTRLLTCPYMSLACQCVVHPST